MTSNAWLQSFYRRRQSNSARKAMNRRRRRVQFESLESRQLMAADITIAPFPTLASADPQGSLVQQGAIESEFQSQVPPFVSSESGGLLNSEKMIFHGGDLYVTSRGNHSIMRYDGTTGLPKPAAGKSGAIFATGGGLNSPIGLAFGPDGNLYVANYSGNSVERFSATGASLGTFVTAGSGGLNGATGLAIDSSGRVYVSSLNSDQVMRYSATGAPLPSSGKSGAVFAQGGGLDGPDGLTFGPDGRLYVSSQNNDQVISFSSTNGAAAAAPFVGPGSGGLDQPLDIRFGSDGALYVVSHSNQSVKRFRGPGSSSPGTFLDTFVPSGAGGLESPTGLAFGLDAALYVTSRDTSRVLRFDGSDGGAGDLDQFTMNIEADQTIALSLAAPPSSFSISHSTLGVLPLNQVSPGQYQAVRIAEAGELTISVQAATGLTTGTYFLSAVLNAQVDTGTDGAAVSQSLALSTTSPDAGIERSAATGAVQRNVARVLAESETNPDLRGSWDRVGSSNTYTINNIGNSTTPLNKGVSGSLTKSGSTSSSRYDALDSFFFDGRADEVVTIRTRGSNSGGGSLSKVLLRLRHPDGTVTFGAAVAGAASDYAITSFTLQQTGRYTIFVDTDSGKKGTYTLLADLTSNRNPRPNTVDIYELNVAQAGSVAASISTGVIGVSNPKVTLTLYAPGVDPLTGSATATATVSGNLDGALQYIATAAGVYKLKVATAPTFTGDSVNYTLATSVGAILDNTLNGSASLAQDLTGHSAVLGELGNSTATFVGVRSGNLDAPVGAAFGPDGNLYVAGRDNDAVLKYDGTSGAYIGVFTSGGGLSIPEGIVFGPDSTGDGIGELFVSSRGLDAVLRYNGATGAFIDRFVSSASGGLDDPHGLAFGPDGNLYVPDRNTGNVLRYNGTTGAFMGVFNSGGGVQNYVDLTFGPDNNLYVSTGNRSINRYDGTTGVFIDEFVTPGLGGLEAPRGLVFGPDGTLYVGQGGLQDKVLRYDASGNFIETYIDSDAGLFEPVWVTFGPDGYLYTTDHVNDRIVRTLPAAEEYFKIDLVAGQQLYLYSATPGDAPGAMNNNLNPSVALLSSSQSELQSGTARADGRNEELTFTAATTGTYYIRLRSDQVTRGEYLLRFTITDPSAEESTTSTAAADELFGDSSDQWIDEESLPG